MPKAKFESIYKDLKQKIESGEYPYQDLLPSENTDERHIQQFPEHNPACRPGTG